MATQFLQLDLSPESRDFEPIAIEPGWPVLDRSNANYRILLKWLGRLIAEPEWQANGVRLFVCNGQGARPHNIQCEPATARDISRTPSLKQDFDELTNRLQDVHPEAKEAKLHAAAFRQFRSLVSESTPAQFECHFFKYKDGDSWRLVWAWGFQRKDLEPAPPTICTNPKCRHLFVRRADTGRTCPACSMGPSNPVPPRRSRSGMLVALLLVALLASGLGYGVRAFLRRTDHNGVAVSSGAGEGLFAAPAQWTGPSGAQIQFKVVRRNAEGGEEDVSARVVAVAESPQILRLDGNGVAALARTHGKTAVHFYLGEEQAHATVDVLPPTNPAKLMLVPHEVTLGVGATARLQLRGQFPEQPEVDLSDRAEWDPVAGRIVSCAEGRVEGLHAGAATVVARYRATADSPYLTAETRITVVDETYKSLEIGIEPGEILAGRSAQLTASVANAAGEKRSVLGSSRLRLEIDAVDTAVMDGDRLRGLRPGSGKLTARFGELTAERPFRVEASPDGQFVVTPKELRLAVGETAELQIVAASSDPIQVVSGSPRIAAVTANNRIVGRAPGKAELTVRQEARAATVLVEVSAPEIESIAFVPSRISVAVDDSVPIRLVGRSSNQREFDLAPEAITWEQLPVASSAELDVRALRLTGRQATGESPLGLTARVGELRTSARIDVVQPPPPVLELTPAGPVSLRAGQAARLRAWARYGDGRRVEVQPGRLQWSVDPRDTTAIAWNAETGVVRPNKPGAASVLISGAYLGTRSAPVEVQVLDGALTLDLKTDRDAIKAGESGRLVVTTDGEGTSGGLLEGLAFLSSDPNILAVDPNSGAYRAVAVGQANVQVSHPNASAPATLLIAIGAGASAPKAPSSVRIVTSQPQPVVLPARARFTNFKVEALFPEQAAEDVTGDSLLLVESDLSPPPATANSEGVEGERSGAFILRASYRGVLSTEGLRFEVREGPLSLDALEIRPAALELASGERAELRVEGFVGAGGERRSVGDVTNRPELGWQSDSPLVVRADGPAMTAVGAGDATVTVTAGKASSSLRVHVGPVADPPILEPDALRMKEGESRWLGRDLRVTRGGVDFSEQAEMASANETIVRVDSRRRSLQAVGPGQTLVAVTALGKSLTLSVEVEPSTPVTGSQGTIVIEPASRSLLVGEQADLRVLLVDKMGQRQDRTASAVVESGDAKILGVSGSRATARTAGEATVTATLPGVDEPGRATIVVSDDPLTRLIVSPAPLRLQVGDRESLKIVGEGASGRRELSPGHPDLKMTLEGEQPNAVELLGNGEVRAALPGKATLRVEWRGVEAAPTPIEVALVPDSGLRIEPPDATIEIGKRATFLVFVRRGDRERPLTTADGLELTVGDPNLASVGRNLTVLGENPGETEVVARLGSRRAAARLTVTPADTGVPPMPPGLRFIPDVLTLQLGVPAASVRLVRVWPDGREEDVDHKAEFTVTDESVVEVKRTNADSNRPVFLGKKLGQANVQARQGGLLTRAPMLVRVVEKPDEPARLEARPDPVTLVAGQAGDFQSVRIFPGAGGPPLTVDFRVESADSRIVAVENGKRMRGVAPGQTRVTVRPDNVPPEWAELKAEVAVQVDPPANEPQGGGEREDSGNGDRPQLVLTGPPRANVGSEVKFRVERQDAAQSRDVTGDGAALVFESEQQGMVEMLPGCAVLARQPGLLKVRARYKDLESNEISVRINPLAGEFQKLELELADTPMSASGETRDYKIWGYPAGGAPRQDLTRLARASGETAGPNTPVIALSVREPAGAEIVQHAPPVLTARAPGVFRIGAKMGVLKSNIVDITISQGNGAPLADLKAEPSSLSVRVGERLPEIRVSAVTSVGERYPVEVQWKSTNDSVVSADAESAGRMVGKGVGEVRLTATHGGRDVSVPVTVTGNLFASVELNKEADWKPGNRFAVTVNVGANAGAEAKVEYRVTTAGGAGDAEGGAWRELRGEGPQKLSLISPDILVGPPETLYNLRIEARSASRKTVETYPLRFRFSRDIQQQPPTGAQVVPAAD